MKCKIIIILGIILSTFFLCDNLNLTDYGTSGFLTEKNSIETLDFIPQYIVSFDFAGGNGTAIPDQFISLNAKIPQPEDPTRDNYVFLGWYRGLGSKSWIGEPWDFEKDTVDTHITLRARWRSIFTETWNITFDSDGGTAIPGQIVPLNGKIAKVKDPTKDTNIFIAWHRLWDSDSWSSTYDSNPWDFDTNVADADITLVAFWRPILTVNFNTGTGKAPETQCVPYGDKLKNVKNPKKLGYKFGGWYWDYAGGIYWDFNSVVYADMTLTAVWETTFWTDRNHPVRKILNVIAPIVLIAGAIISFCIVRKVKRKKNL